MDSFEYEGIWWLPTSEENQVAGNLKFSKREQPALKLIGTLASSPNFDKADQYPIVHGLTRTGKAITLLNAIETNSNTGIPGFTSQTLACSVIFVGCHFEQKNDIKFHSLHVEYNHLSKWISTSGMEIKLSHNNGKLTKYEVSYEYPEEITATLPDAKIVATYRFNIDVKQFPLEKVDMRQDTYLKIEHMSPTSLEEALKRFVIPLRNLLTLATNSPNFITQLTGYYRDEDKSDVGGRAEDAEVQIYFSENNRSETTEASPLFTVQDTEISFSDLLNKWFSIADELDSVCNLFFGVLYSERMYTEHKFANFVQAAESYHRRRFSNQVLPKPEHKQMITEILQEVPEQYKGWLKEQLAFSNETRFKERIRQLVDFAGRVISPLVIDTEAFVTAVTNTRNYNTHHDTRLKERTLRDADLYWLSQTLSFLVQACLIRELGFSDEQCVNLFAENRDYRFAVRRVREGLG